MFKRGTVIDAEYNFVNDLYIHGIKQNLIIIDIDGNEYETTWISENSEDFFGEGDKVSFFLYDNNMIRLRLNPFGVSR